MNRAKLQRYAGDPGAFQQDLILPSAVGLYRFGDIMADFQRTRFANLNPALLALAHGRKPDIGRDWWEATKGCSKDTDLAVCILWLLAFTRRRLLCQVGAADADQAAELRKAAQDILHANLWLAQRVTIDKWQIACKATGGVCDIIAADVAGSHGARPDLLVLNELSHVTKQEFAENLMDNAAKVPYGLAVVATNAGHTGTWQYQWRELARESARWCFEQYAAPSPWMDPDEVSEAKQRNSTTRFMRLFYGVWSPNAGDALDQQAIDDAITLQGPMAGRPSQPGDDWSFVAGLDLGVCSDHAALVVLGCQQGKNRIALADCRSWTPPKGGQIDLAAIESAIVIVHRRFHLQCLWVDPFQAILMSQNLRRQHLVCEPMDFVGKNLNLMASTLLDVFNSRSIDLYNEPQLIRDLGRLTIVEKSYGYKLESTRDADGHADRATALAIALPAAAKLAHYKAFTCGVPRRIEQSPLEPMRHGVLVDLGRRR